MPFTGLCRIGHIGITVRDLDRSIEFYTSVLGLRLTERFEYPEDAEVGHGTAIASGAFIRCDTTHHCISLFCVKESVGSEAASPNRAVPVAGLHHIAFELSTPEELLDLHRRMSALPETVVEARRGGPGNQPRFYALDPDGHLLEFYWGIDRIGWEGRARSYPPIEAIDLETFDFAAFVFEREHAAQFLSVSGVGTATESERVDHP